MVFGFFNSKSSASSSTSTTSNTENNSEQLSITDGIAASTQGDGDLSINDVTVAQSIVNASKSFAGDILGLSEELLSSSAKQSSIIQDNAAKQSSIIQDNALAGAKLQNTSKAAINFDAISSALIPIALIGAAFLLLKGK